MNSHRFTSALACRPLLLSCLGVLGAFFAVAAAEDEINWAKEREFWSFRAPVAQQQPLVRNKRWPSQPLDYFILARLEQKGLAPAAEAEKSVLIRRVTFDLTGLPPTPEEARAFLQDRSARAYQRVVDRLLASPRFGERMASMWLPLARYAEDQAHQVGTDTKFFYPNAWKYRDWVIGAFNRDVPYDQFIRLQLAADQVLDELKAQGSKSKVGDATRGERERGTLIFEPTPDDLPALGFIGLGPKYYNRNRLDVMADEWEDRVDTVTRSFLGLTVACARCHDHKFEPITRGDYYALAGVFASTRMVNKVPGRPTPAKEDNSETPPKEKFDPATMHIVEEGLATNLNIFIRGNVERKGPVAERRFLPILSDGEPAPFKDGSGRKELADKIASRENPLTARVMVNRVWGVFFGHPLVATPSNFGHSGNTPTHPQLLDDLAVRFMANGWSMKSLVREMVLSSTYRQASGAADLRRPAPRPSLVTSAARSEDMDPSNELLSHMNRRRLTIEQWRDAVLFVSGELVWEEGKTSEVSEPTNHLRTVFGHVSRLKLNDLLMQFDYPDANVHAEKRSVTTTATQKLFLLNSPFMMARAKALAARMTADAKESDKSRVRRAYRLLFAREPEKEELNVALKFLGQPVTVEMSRWEQYAQVLLASNEMLYVD